VGVTVNYITTVHVNVVTHPTIAPPSVRG
jgi:hypothetical protein